MLPEPSSTPIVRWSTLPVNDAGPAPSLNRTAPNEGFGLICAFGQLVSTCDQVHGLACPQRPLEPAGEVLLAHHFPPSVSHRCQPAGTVPTVYVGS